MKVVKIYDMDIANSKNNGVIDVVSVDAFVAAIRKYNATISESNYTVELIEKSGEKIEDYLSSAITRVNFPEIKYTMFGDVEYTNEATTVWAIISDVTDKYDPYL